jgi:hypothetical protein
MIEYYFEDQRSRKTVFFVGSIVSIPERTKKWKVLKTYFEIYNNNRPGYYRAYGWRKVDKK